MYIPRKPHPNGLLEYIFATYIENPVKKDSVLPYAIHIMPHLQVGDVNPINAILQFLSTYVNVKNILIIFRYPLHIKPHIIGDAAFGNLDVIQKIKQWGGMATFSMNESNTTWLWNLLSYKTPPHTWRAAITNDGIIGSLHTIEDSSHKMIHQQLITTGFCGTIHQFTNESNTNRGTINSGSKYLSLKQYNLKIVETVMPIFTSDCLKKKKIVELNEICTKYNIHKGNIKKNL